MRKLSRGISKSTDKPTEMPVPYEPETVVKFVAAIGARGSANVEHVSSNEIANLGSMSRGDHDMGDCGLAKLLALTQLTDFERLLCTQDQS